MQNPAVGRVSSEFGRRNPIPGVTTGTFHAGIDIANKTGTPIYAAYAGTVAAAGWSIVRGRSGNGVLIENPDGEKQYYGHLSRIDVRVGQRVSKGQRIGLMGATGNVTGPHLHFETWNRNGNPVNPRIHFKYHGVVPGVGAPAPAPAPSTPVLSATVKARLKRMGLPQTVEGVKTYQRAHGLYPDGTWGGVTDRYFLWVEALQTSLNRWKAVNPKLYIDGYRGRKTVIAEDAVISRNRGLVGSSRASLYRYLGIPEPSKRP